MVRKGLIVEDFQSLVDTFRLILRVMGALKGFEQKCELKKELSKIVLSGVKVERVGIQK